MFAVKNQLAAFHYHFSVFSLRADSKNLLGKLNFSFQLHYIRKVMQTVLFVKKGCVDFGSYIWGVIWI